MKKAWKKDVAGLMAALMVVGGVPLSNPLEVMAAENNAFTIMKESVSGNEAGEVVLNASDLNFVSAWYREPVAGPTLSFAGNYAEVWLELPQAIAADDLEKLDITVSGQEGTVCFKLYDASSGDLGTYYNQSGKSTYSIMPTGSGEITHIGVMSNDDARAEEDYPFGITIENVTYKLDESEAGPTENETIVYTYDDLTVGTAWSFNPVEGPTFSFSGNYEEYWLKLPKAIPSDGCVKFDVEVSGQEGAVCFKLYNAANEDIGTYYAQSGKTVYSVMPKNAGEITHIGIMSNDDNRAAEDYPFSITFEKVTIELEAAGDEGNDPEEIPSGVNLIRNPNFAEEDVTVWGEDLGTATIEPRVAAEPIFDEVTTYGAIVGERGNYNCFAQDITDVMEKNQEYQFEFYAMLDAEDYAEAPATQRQVQFAPFIVVNGEANYGPKTSGTTIQTLTPGVWTKYSGTFTPSWTGKKVDRIVLRLLEQGENYGQGDGVKGRFYVTGVSLMKVEKEPIHIQEDIPDWKESIVEAFGSDVIAGTAMTQGEFADETLVALAGKHFNAVTFGNELKPDSIFGYSNSKCPGTQTVTLNGEELVVPTTNFSRGDAMADAILEWNEAHPDDQLKVRGHVLVWHSQTPEWFFHEDYDKNNAYVSKEEMTKRQEWFIKTVLEHYVGAESPYKDLFYGWDVVNEAISDATGTYRTDAENAGESLSQDTHGSNSSWWHVYESNEFIINAFRFANKYAPASLELYYNDYNDQVEKKSEGIAALLKAVKDAEGTRIDAFGMQAHYTITDFNAEQFLAAARKYVGVVGKVQLTELDFKTGGIYDGTDASREAALQKIAQGHKQIFESLKTLEAEKAGAVGGIVVWGVIEPNSWLHTQSGVGGGANGTSSQCPLLFDGNYQAKPAYWAYVNAEELSPVVQNIVVAQAEDGIVGNTYSIADANATFVPVWTSEGLKVKVTVKDAAADETDSITVYVDPENTAGAITPIKVTVARAEAKSIEGGYEAEIDVPLTGLAITKKISMDVVIKDGDKTVSFNDTKNTQETSSKFYAVATMKPAVKVIPQGKVTIDGKKEGSWKYGVQIPLTINLGSKVTADATLLWDKDNLYVLAEVKDSVLNADSTDDYQKDSLEVFIDENNHKTGAYEEDDKQYRINYLNEHSFNGAKCLEENVKSAVTLTEDGYVVEAAYKWTDITPVAGTQIGLELQINDADATGKRVGTLSWYDETGMGWSSTAIYGTVTLGETNHTHEAATEWASDENSHWNECVAGDGERMNEAEHTFDAGVVTTQPTCTKPGVKTYTCTVCKATKTEEVAPTKKHTYTKKITPATTKADGKVTYTCKDCGKVKTSTIYKISSIKLSKTSTVYNGKKQKPVITIKDSRGKELTPGKYFTVKYSDNKLPGKAVLTIKLKRRYSGTVKKTFKILPKATSVRLTSKKNAFDYKITKGEKITGYQLQYSTSAKFTEKTTQSITIKGNDKLGGTVKNLKAKKKYYVRVRAYKTVSGKKYYSAWSKTASTTTK